jgi:hypothetical protein
MRAISKKGGSMRTKFTQFADGSVYLGYMDEFGIARAEIFSVGTGEWGYVRRADGTQVCEKLKRRGSTLKSNRDHLLSTIKAEFRKLRTSWETS